MLLQLEKKIADYIKANALGQGAEGILLAVSGGADSTALLYAMCKLKAEGVLDSRLVCGHINHQLRGSESDADQRFVVAQAEKLKLCVVTKQVDVLGFARENKLSIETAARQLRIESLGDIARANNCGAIATAHHADDNAETIIQRLARGTGFRGLGGIWPSREFAGGIKFVRPLLAVSREEIIEYLRERSLEWQLDSTNSDCRYRRNFIRHQLIPELQKQCSGSLTGQLAGLAESARGFYNLICAKVEEVWPGIADCDDAKTALNLKGFSEQPAAVKIEMVRRSLVRLGCGERNLSQEHFERILRLAGENVSGKKIELPNGFLARLEYGELIFSKPLRGDKERELCAEITIPSRGESEGFLIDARVFEIQEGGIEQFESDKGSFVECFDLAKIKLPLTVRRRRDGDRFLPLGQTESTKVGKFLTAQRIPRAARAETLIVADGEKIIWLWPIRISEQVKVAAKTKKILRLQISGGRMG